VTAGETAFLWLNCGEKRGEYKMNEEIFVLFDTFMVKKTEIIYSQIKQDNSVELHIKKGTNTQILVVPHEDYYRAKETLSNLAMTVDATVLNYNKTALIEQIGWLTGNIRTSEVELERISKELKYLRIELRRNRINIKKDKNNE